MPSLPFVKWYPSQFIAATLGWSLAERGLYQALLNAQWELGPLPKDKAAICRIVSCSPEEFEAAWPRVKPKFMANGETIWNQRLEEHRKTAEAKHARRVAAGGKGAQKRWGSKSGKGGGKGGGTSKNTHLQVIDSKQSNSNANSNANSILDTRDRSSSLSSTKNLNRTKRKSVDFSSIENLDQKAWGEWLAYRRERRLATYKTKRIANQLAALPPRKQLECVQWSIDQGYNGLFPERFEEKAHGASDRRIGARRPSFDESTEQLASWVKRNT